MRTKLKSACQILLLFMAICILPVQTMADGEVYTTFTGAGYGGADTIFCDLPITIEIHYFNDNYDVVNAMVNGYKLFSTVGTAWQTPVADTAGGLGDYFNMLVQLDQFSVDGIAADTFGLGAVAMYGGMPIGYDEVVLTISTQVDCSQIGGTICLDSSWYPINNDWLWVLPGSIMVYPYWDGPHCFEIFQQTNTPPEITNCPPEIIGSHCNMMVYDFDAFDPDSDPYWFEIISGPGTINPSSGVWTYQPTPGGVGSQEVVVHACDAISGCGTECIVYITITNYAPIITNCPTDPLLAEPDVPMYYTFEATDPDYCVPLSFSIVNAIPYPVGSFFINPTNGEFEFIPDSADVGTDFYFTAEVSDGVDTDGCDFTVEVDIARPLIKIEHVEDALPGYYEFVSITLENSDLEMGGFDFLIAYNSDDLTFIEANPGWFMEGCDWQYFSYHYISPPGGVTDQLIRLVGYADSGPDMATCYGPDDEVEIELVELKLQVDPGLTLGYSSPIYFFWDDCNDNVVSSTDGSAYYIDRAIYDFEENLIWDEDDDIQFPDSARPNYIGAPDFCIDSFPSPAVRYYDYQHGALTIDSVKEAFSIPEAYANLEYIDGTEVNVWGEYTTENDGRLVTCYLDYRNRRPMPPFSTIFLTGAVPDSGYWQGGIIIACGSISYEYDSLSYYPEDTLDITLYATSFIYIDSGFQRVPDTVNFPLTIEFDNNKDEQERMYPEECDSCKFAILVSGSDEPGFWDDIERLYKHKVEHEGYCPENIEILYHDGNSGDSIEIPNNQVHPATQAEVRAAHDRIAAKLRACDSAGDTATVQKMFTNHGSKNGICLAGNEILTGDSLRVWQDTLIASCADYLYDEILTCYGGRIVESLKTLNDKGKTEIHVNSEAGPNSCAWGYSWGSIYLFWKIKALEAGLDYETAVNIARQVWRQDMLSDIADKEIELLKLKILYKSFKKLGFRSFARIIARQIAELKADLADEQASLDDPGLAFYRMQFRKYCEWKIVRAPAGGQIKIEFDGTGGCGNVTIYEVQPDGTIKKIRIWNWNLPGSYGYVEGNETRIINVSPSSTGLFLIHNDNGQFTATAQSYFNRPSPIESPSNISSFAGFSLGSNDSSSAEFGNIFEPEYYICCVNSDDFNLSNIPSMMDPWETVHTLTTQFDISETNAWWGDVELSLDILDVWEPGLLLIGCSDPGIGDTSITITEPGEYTIHLGGFQTRGSVELTFHTPQIGGATIEWDCWSLRTLVPVWPEEYECGDVNDDDVVNIFDVTYMISYLYKGGLPPVNMNAADVNSDGAVNIFDITYLISYLYKNGPYPNCP